MKFQLLSLFLASQLVAPIIVPAGEDHMHTMGAPRGLWKEFVELKMGNNRYSDARAKAAMRDGESAPKVVVLSCSDAPIAPEVIFDRGSNKLLSLRSLGASLDAQTVASLEHAVNKLGAKVLVVLGHDSCGAIRAALTKGPQQTTGSNDQDAVLASIRARIKHQRAVAYVDDLLKGPARSNVHGVVRELFKRSQAIREAVERGKLLIAQGIYLHETGKVEFWEAGHPPSAEEDQELDGVSRGETN